MRVVRSKAFRIVRAKVAPVAAHERIIVPEVPGKVMRWESTMDLSEPGTKKFTEIKEGDNVVDYRDVQISGYLSTFKSTTESDRDGDYVDQGAFTDTIPKFMRNPVMLVNHWNSVENIGGSFTKVKEDKKGLYVEGKLSNSQAPGMIDLRAKVAEGHLRTLSMGGIFHYKEDGRGIFKVDLWEGSLVAIPANPDATFSVRQLTEHESKAVKQGVIPTYRETGGSIENHGAGLLAQK